MALLYKKLQTLSFDFLHYNNIHLFMNMQNLSFYKFARLYNFGNSSLKLTIASERLETLQILIFIIPKKCKK